MTNELFWRLNTNTVIAGGVLLIVFLLYYIAFGKESKTSKSKVRLAK